jgi:hypothetical protein
MAEDKREDILVLIKTILTEVAGDDVFVYRNMIGFEDNELPAYVLLDGLETMDQRASDRRGPQVMVLQPQIFYLPVPTINPKNTGVGEDLSAKRVVLIKKIMGDGRLRDKVGTNGYVEYRGMETDMQAGADEAIGRFRLDFAFAYLFNFNKL